MKNTERGGAQSFDKTVNEKNHLCRKDLKFRLKNIILSVLYLQPYLIRKKLCTALSD